MPYTWAYIDYSLTVEVYLKEFMWWMPIKQIWGGDSRLVANNILVQKSSIVWRQCGYLSADRDGASPNSNCKWTYLIFRTLDWAAPDVMPTIANESQLLTDCLGGCKHDLDISNVLFPIIYNWLWTRFQDIARCKSSSHTEHYNVPSLKMYHWHQDIGYWSSLSNYLVANTQI